MIYIGKYAPLSELLQSTNEEEVLSLADLERLLKFSLPDSARRYPAWWGQSDAAQQSECCMDIGRLAGIS